MLENLGIVGLALAIREAENALLNVYNQGLIGGTLHTCVGQEMTPAVLSSLAQDSFWFSNHRGHGHYLARTGDLDGLFREVLGREGGCASGVGGTQHLLGEGFMSSGVQGGLLPIGVGFAEGMASDYSCSVVFLGDGTLGQGVVYESWNLASMLGARCLFVLEDNGIAQSTPSHYVFAGSLIDRVKGFGLEYLISDANHPGHLRKTLITGLEYARAGHPTLVRVLTSRLNSHSKGDDNRSPELVAALRHKDFLNRYIAHFPGDELGSEIRQFVADKMKSAIGAKPLCELTQPLDRAEAIRIQGPITLLGESDKGPNTKQIDRVNAELRNWLQRDSRNVIWGEDIEDHPAGMYFPYGGAYKATRGLSTEFGASRVRNFPISESAMIGAGIGRALSGRSTMVEIMFSDFMTLTADQVINHAEKIPTMYGTNVDIPLTVRVATGGGRGYGPTHSGNLERLFVGDPNLMVSTLTPYGDYARQIELANEMGLLHIIAESKADYQRAVNITEPKGYRFRVLNAGLGTLLVEPKVDIPPHWLILTYGNSLWPVLDALEELILKHEVTAVVMAPTLLSPFDASPLKEVRDRGIERVLIVEESQAANGVGRYWSTVIADHLQGRKSPVLLGGPPLVPSATELELSLRPNSDQIISLLLADDSENSRRGE